jgi:hypothetical protein
VRRYEGGLKELGDADNWLGQLERDLNVLEEWCDGVEEDEREHEEREHEERGRGEDGGGEGRRRAEGGQGDGGVAEGKKSSWKWWG